MATIAVSVQSAIVDETGTATITVKATSGGSSWQKIYKYRQTETIKLANFKDRVKSDLMADFGTKNQLAEITPIVGQSFNLTV